MVQGSLEDWDDNMQTECANAFIEILKNNVSVHVPFLELES